MKPTIDRLRTACARLDDNRPRAVLEAIGKEPEGAAAQSLVLAAQGLLHERSGNNEAAERCFEQVFAMGVPFSALLRQTGRYFNRVGRYTNAYHCYSLLEGFDAQAMDELLPPTVAYELPAAELARFAPWALERSRRGGPWVLWPIKMALADQLGWEATAMLFGDLAGPGWQLADLRATSLLEFARGSDDYQELLASMPVSLPPIPALGVARRDGFDARTRTTFVCRIEDGVVSSKSNLLLTGERALLDYQDDELDRVPIDVHVDPVVFGADAERLNVMVQAGAVIPARLDRAFPLVGVNSGNFGHWLLEFLPKVWAFREHPQFRQVPILIDEQMPPQHRQALEYFVGSEHPIIVLERGEAVRVRELWVCSTMAYFPIAPKAGAAASTDLLVLDENFAKVLADVRPKPGPSAATGEKLYLSRRDTQHRRLVNRSEVEEWFRAEGFDIVDFGRLPFGEQLERVQSAEIVVGPDGSSLLMTLFARAGTRIGVLDNPYLQDNAWYVLVSEALGQRVQYLCGEVVERDPDYNYQSSYAIDLDDLPKLLEELSCA